MRDSDEGNSRRAMNSLRVTPSGASASSKGSKVAAIALSCPAEGAQSKPSFPLEALGALFDRLLLICFVGSASEDAHDEYDRYIEALGRVDIVTTWHSDDDLDEVASLVQGFVLADGVGEVYVLSHGADPRSTELQQKFAEA
jgi:hypothetical protein